LLHKSVLYLIETLEEGKYHFTGFILIAKIEFAI
jgi:hypothetical protein